MSLLEIPAQVWFLIAGAAVCALLGDAAVRSWRSPERVADPSTMWPRWAPVISDRLIGPRLPGGSFRMPERGLRLGWGPGGSFFEDVEVHPYPRPAPIVVVPPAGAAFWSRLEGGDDDTFWSWAQDSSLPDVYPFSGAESTTVRLDSVSGTFTPGATLDWSPLNEHAAADAARLPLDDVDEWLAERVREYERALTRISCRTVSLVRGEICRTVDEEFEAFMAGSQALHAYREMRIGNTGELDLAAMRRELAKV